MILHLLIVLASLEGSSGDRPWQVSLDARDYRAAWNLTEEEPDAVERQRARAAILYRAGDPAGALAAAEVGLRLQPDHLELLHHAAASSIWLEDSGSALQFSSRLLQVVQSDRQAGMPPADRDAWRAAAQDFLELSRALASNAEGRRRSIERARAIATAGLVAAVALAAWAARRYGRSSRPVS